MVRMAIVLGLLAAGCSSSSNNLSCCFNINGDTSLWTCPDQASFATCCNPDTPVGCGQSANPANACTETQGATCSP